MNRRFTYFGISFRIVLVSCLLLVGVGESWADIYQWNLTGNGSWASGSNWLNVTNFTTGTVPPSGAGHTIIIDPSSSATITNVPSGTYAKLVIGLSNTTNTITLNGATGANRVITLTGAYPTDGLQVNRSLTLGNSTNVSIVTNGAILANTKTITVASSRTLTVTGYFLNQGTILGASTTTFICNANTCTVDYNSSNAQTIATTNYYNLTCSSAGNRTLPSGTVSIAGLFNDGTNSFTVNNNSTVIFNGTSAQFIPSLNGAAYYNLQLNNAAGATTTGGAVNVGTASNGTFTLTNGILTSSAAAKLTIRNTATTAMSPTALTSYSATKFIRGPIERAIPNNASNGTYIFPIGEGSNYKPIELVALTTSGTAGSITAECKTGSTGGSPGAGLSSLFSSRYYQMSVSTVTIVTTTVRITDTGLGATNRIAQSATQSGTYSPLSNLATTTTTVQSTASLDYALNYFVLATQGSSNLCGTYTVGPTGNFRKLQDVATILGLSTLTCDCYFEFQPTYNGTTGEQGPIIFTEWANSGGPWSVYIRPQSGVASMLTTSDDPGSYTIALSPTSNAFISFSGVDRLTLDGRPGGAGSTSLWTIRNTRTTSTIGPTIDFIHHAQNNTLQYVTVEGQSTGSIGTVYIGANNAAGLGNDNILIDHCTIRDRSDVTGIPANAIYSNGTAFSGRANDNVTISNNNIFNFSTTGIYANSSNNGADWTISGNSIYSTLAASTVQTGINFGSSGSGGHMISGNYIGGNGPLNAGTWTNSGNVAVTGINVDAVTTATISGNFIRNFNLTSTSSSARFAGINVNATGSKTITGNVISNVTSTSTNTSSNGISCMVGVACANNMYVVGNTIHSLTNTASAAAVKIIGIYGAPTPTANVEKNFIHSLGLSTSSTSAQITGLYLSGSTSNGTVQNNMIRLGIKADGTAVLTGVPIIGIEKNTASRFNFYHNSVFIGGTQTGTQAGNSFAFRRTTSPTAAPNDVLMNNIFWNNRSNTTSGGTHYAIWVSNLNFLTSDYNDIFANGSTGAMFGNSSGANRANLAAWRTATSQDASSISADPMFINPTGDASAVDLHIQAPPVSTTIESAGFDVGVAEDIDGDARASFSPTDIGADAGIFSGIDLAAPIISYTALTGACQDAATASLANVSITDVSGVNVTTGTAPRVYYKKSSDPNSLGGTNDNTTPGWKWVETSSALSPFTFALDLNKLSGGIAPGDVIQYFVVAQDEGPNVGTPNVAINSNNAAFANAQTSVDLAANAFPIGGAPNTLTIVPCSGTVDVGTGVYPAFTTADGIFQALNIASAAGIINGNITINVTANITIENGVHALNEIASPYTLTIQSSAAANRDISSAAGYAGALFRLNGADRVTFNGGSGTDRFLTFRNTNVSTSAATFQFLNGATNNKINNCIIESGSTSNASGAIHFATDVVTATGNDDNIIDNCDIRDLTTTNANFSTGIYSNGTASKENSGNTISNCNIYNFYNTTSSAVAGISLGANNTQWTITGNKFFQKTRTSASSGASFYGILISTNVGSGFTITDNLIGYENAAGTGTFGIPSTGAARFNCIHITTSGLIASATNTITGNQISNISLTSTTGGSSGLPLFSGIYAVTGKFFIDGNTIGSLSANGNITLTTSSSLNDQIAAIYTNTIASGQTISNNNIGGITLTSTSGNIQTYLNGIRIITGSANVSGNTIGGTVANSMRNSSSATTSTTICAGITCTSVSAYTVNIDNNTIQNLTTTAASTGAQVIGIATSGGGQFSITGNTVRTLTTNSTSTGSTTSASVIGISMNTSNTSALTISGNTVYDLTNTTSTNNVNIEGIYFSGGTNTSNAVARNLVYNLTSSSTGTSGTTYGIHLGGGAVTASNNMVRLGIASNGTPHTVAQAISGIQKDGTGATNIYYNSVYIGGSSAGTPATYAFRRVSTATDAVRNNIFFNARTNSSSGKSYAVHVSSTTGLTQDYNIIYNVGTGTVFGVLVSTEHASLTAWRAATVFDDNSVSADPQFTNATGATPNLNLNPAVATPAESGGVVISGLTDDFGALNVRTGYPQTQINGGGTAPDIGADENDLIPIDATAPTFTYTNIPTQGLCAPVTTTVSVTVTDAQSGISLTSNKPRMYFRRSSPSSAWDANQFVEGVNTSGNANSSVWSFTIDYAAFGITPASSNTFEYYFVAQDQETPANIGYSQSNGTTPVHTPDVAGSGTLTLPNFAFGATGTYAFGSPLSGPVTVGSGGTYTTFNGASGLFAAINANGLNGDLTVSVISTPITETAYTPLNAHAEYCGGPYTITIQPATNADYVIQCQTAQSGITFNGARRVIIDGNHSGNRRLIFRDINGTAANGEPVFWFNGGANNITLKNSIIESANTSSPTGNATIVFGGPLATGTGVNNVTLENNQIRNRSDLTQNATSTPLYAFLSQGPGTSGAGLNHTNRIINNEIFNFRQGGVVLALNGVNNSCNGPFWNISGNKIYNPIASASTQYPINIQATTSYSDTIHNNVIAGSAADGSGTWTNSSLEIQGIYVQVGGSSLQDTTSIHGNVIRNITMTSTGYSNFEGINVADGFASVSYNTVGTDAGLNNIVINGNGDLFDVSAYTWVYGIWAQSSDEVIIDHNLVGGLTAAGNLALITGIRHGHVETFTLQTIPAGKATITNNIVGNLATASTSESFIIYPGSCSGIVSFSNSNNNLIKDNAIAGLQIYSGAVRSTRLTALVVDGWGANGGGIVSGNQIRVLNNNCTGTTPTIVGIYTGFLDNASHYTFQNNMISVTNPTLTNAVQMVGIHDFTATGSTQNYYYNSVHIGGSSSGGSKPSVAFNMDNLGGTVSLRNNILMNTRTGGSGTHRAIGNELGSWQGGSCNYNFLATANASTVGVWGATTYNFNNWQTASGSDANSKNATTTTGSSSATLVNPSELFTDVSIGNLSILAGPNVPFNNFVDNFGTPVSTPDDYEGEPRHATTPDIGVDESISCAQPTITSATPGSGCGTTSVQLEATASAGVINWYDDMTGGNQVGTGSPFNTPAISSTTTYYAEANDNGCISAVRTAVTATISTPTSVTWTAGASAAGDKTDWFNANNWTCNTVPTATIDAVIPTSPAGGSFFPVVDNPLSAATRDLTIESGASLTIDYDVVGSTPQGELAVHGILTNNSSTSVVGSGFLTLKAGASAAGAFTVDYLKVDGNASLAAGATVNVKKELALFSGTFTVPATAALNLKSDVNGTAYINDFEFATAPPYGTMTGNVTIERYIPPTGSANIFHYIGGVTGGTAASKWGDDFNMGVIGTDGFITPLVCDPVNPRTAASSNYGGLFTYHESNVTDCYLRGWKVERNTFTVEPGRGLAARINSGVILEETGDYHADNTTVTNMTKTATNLVSFSQGYNLVSNPFYAPIQWQDVATDNLAAWDGAAYVYEPTLGNYTVHNLLTGPYTINTNQAFFVRTGNSTPVASNLTFIFNADTRTKGDNTVFYRRQGYEYGLDITVESNGKTDKAILAFDARFSDAFENGYDAAKLYNDAGVPSVYTKAGNDQHSIQALPLISGGTKSIPLSVLVTTTGTHTFTFDGVEDFPQTSIIWLEDLQTGTIQYLRDNNIYSFTATVGDNNDRFVLHFAPELLITTTTSDCSGNSGAITLEQRGGIEWAFRMKDANGAVVGSNVFSATETLSQLPAGAYTLNLTHPVSGYATTMTVVVDGLQPVTAAIDAPVTTVLEGETFTLDAYTTGSTTYTWNMGDHTTYVDLPSVTYAYSVPGSYDVLLTASNEGCSAQATVRIVVNKRDTVSTGIPGVDAAGEIRIHENGDKLYITQHVSRNAPTARVTVYNTLGQAVMGTDVKEMAFGATYTLDVHAAAGIYYVQVELADGQSVLRKVMLGEER